jgi:hypothetical protein
LHEAALLIIGALDLRLAKVIVGIFFLIAVFVSPTRSQTASPLPERVEKFKQSGPLTPTLLFKHFAPVDEFSVEYRGNNGSGIMVNIARFQQDGEAYELLSTIADGVRAKNPGLEIKPDYGTAGIAIEDQIWFCKGTSVVQIQNTKGTNATSLDAFAKGLSESIDKGEGDIPVLIKHLPNPEEAQKNAVYLNSFAGTGDLELLQQPVLSAVQSEGNADAALARYGPSRVLLIEFHTPQLAADNDRRIIARIQELWKLGQPAPTAYKRVGNYSVFVFDAPDEQTAKELISQVKYEQVVQWLGENPNILKEAEKRYINTTLGVLIAVLKASGYALIACLGMGALIGGLLFSYRRAQQKTVTFSDAGGMLRLNLDELTAETDPSRLLRERN